MIRVVIADDQRSVREGLALLVGLMDDIEVSLRPPTAPKPSTWRSSFTLRSS